MGSSPWNMLEHPIDDDNLGSLWKVLLMIINYSKTESLFKFFFRLKHIKTKHPSQVAHLHNRLLKPHLSNKRSGQRPKSLCSQNWDMCVFPMHVRTYVYVFIYLTIFI